MPVIKRYPNRKLYDTKEKQYITLDGIAALIRKGQDVQVLDYASGDDLTALTLAQIICEQEKKHHGFLPHPVLTGLIQAGGDTLSTLRRGLASSLGLLGQVEDEIRRRIRLLVAQGELTEEEGIHLMDKLVCADRLPQVKSWPREEDLELLLAQRGVPSREDLQKVAAQLDALAAKIEQVSHKTE